MGPGSPRADDELVAALGDLGRLRRVARLLVDDGAAYVHRTLVNLAARRWRRRALARRRDHAALEWTVVGLGADDVVAERDRTLRAVLALAPRRRAIVVLRFYEDRPLREIAGVLGVSEGTVKSRPRATPRCPRGSGTVVSTDLEHRLNHDLKSVDDVPIGDVGPGDLAAAGVARMARRRRAAAGAAAAVVVVAGAAGLWVATADRPDVTGPATAPPATAPAATVPAETLPATPPPTTTAPSPAQWTLLAADPRGAVVQPAVAWTGEEAIVIGGRDAEGVRVATAMAYAAATDTWRAIADPPPLGDAPVAVWTGEAVIVVDAASAHVYDPEADEWQTAAAPPSVVAASAPWVWTGDELLAWTEGAGPVAYAPTTDTWRALPAPPIESRHNAASVWTGTEWIVWGGTGVLGSQLGDGAAYDPAADTWRTLAPSLLTGRRARGAWTGSEVLIAAGSSGGDPVTGNGAFAHDDGAAYDPVTDTWRPLATGPAHPGFEPLWTGHLLLQFAKGGAHAYDPAVDQWLTCCGRAGPDVGAGVGGSPLWTGSTVLLLGSADPTAGGVALTPPG